ncbi:hypothetical protein AMK59_6317 [Oryctes borbonicus]|uniref:Ionotropic glutamate receptor L-glutamate and glycine-binding domain-containing protein n=1 Tax=Oryctes borbonicus TaxID=1629725 RepID=A0A0T6B416_9SCAR|nr:hypothetical protein AMK59_6317 [Oryctes borbonicus]
MQQILCLCGGNKMRISPTGISALIIVAFFTLRTSTSSNCIVGFLDDTSDVINRLAFKSEIEKYDLLYSIKYISTDRFYDTLSTVCDMLENGVVALFGPQTEDNFQIVHSVCYSKDIPHIETRWNDNPQKLTFTVNLYPHAPTFGEVLAKLVDFKKWTTFTIFYDDHQSLSRISGILKVIRKSAISIKQLDPNNTENYRPVLKEAWKDGFRNFVLDCHIDRLPNVLKQAQQIGLMTIENAYIITNPDLQTINMESYKYSDTNITGIRMVDPDSEAAIRLAESINIQQSNMDVYKDRIEYIVSSQIRLDTALLVDGLRLLNMAFESLPYHGCESNARCSNDSSWHDGATILASLKTISFDDGITGPVQLDAMGHRQKFQLDIIELRENGLVKVGSWDAKKGITFLEHEDSGNLQNNSFRVITTLTAPYGMLKESEKPLSGNDQYEGFAIDLIHELSLVEKFNYTFIIREDKANGDWNNVSKEWSGMIGDLLREVIKYFHFTQGYSLLEGYNVN